MGPDMGWRWVGGAVVALAWLVGCGGGPAPAVEGGAAPGVSVPLPELAPPADFVPPVPTVLSIPRVPPVWLIERHDVPLVAMHVVVPYGSAADPAGKGGLAALTAEMMEQGAGRRGALELGQAAERLGAELTVGAGRDASGARLVVLSENLEPALALLADVVARPRFEAEEWQRTQPLWRAGLESRAFDPGAVAAVVTQAALYGADHPYGHPVSGTVGSVDGLSLEDVKGFHARHWRPERAAIVVVGDVTPERLRALLPGALVQWAGAGEPPPPPAAPPTPGAAPPVVLVARPDSPQTMLVMAEPGPAASDPGQVAAALVNIPLGGSFTSRLNLNLREDKGYTYGARSSVPFDRGVGVSRAGAAVQSAVTAAALRELRAELAKMAEGGATAAEVHKARATARSEDVEVYETVAGAADRLADLAGLGLPPSFDADAAARRARLDQPALRAALEALPSAGATLVAVGDPAVVEAALAELGLPKPVRYDPEGRPLAGP